MDQTSVLCLVTAMLRCDKNFKLNGLFVSVSEMNLLPLVPSQFQNVTLLQNTFIATFLASLGATTFRNILGESVILSQ